MLEQEHIELSKHRIEKAEEMLKDAESLLAYESYRSSNNRAYYCIYHALRALKNNLMAIFFFFLRSALKTS